MNSIAKITIPIQNLYEAINSQKVLEAQQSIKRMSADGECFSIHNVSEYNNTSYAIKEANDAIKAIQEARKLVTTPLDQYKKELMRIEAEATNELSEFITSAKAKMLEYTNELDRKHKEEQERIQQQANSMAALTDQLAEVNIQHTHIKGVRTIKRARIKGEVDWMTVLRVQFSSGELHSDDLIRGIINSMNKMGVSHIDGIEIYEEKIQTVIR